MPDSPHIVDGDAGFAGANDRDHPSRLPAGIVAEARNARFDRGEPWPRWAVNVAPWSHSSQFDGGTLLAACRMFEPDTGEEAALVATDAVRSNTDGGRGKVFKVTAGGTPTEISMAGYDIWGACRLVPARRGVILLRHGTERLYIPAANVAISTNRITTNRAHGLANGDTVWVRNDAGVASNLLPDTLYYVKYIAPTVIELYSDAGLSTIVDLTTTGTRFALEIQKATPGPGGNGCVPLLLQNSANALLWDSAWTAVPQDASATVGASGTTWAAANHRFANGESVSLSASWTTTTGAISAGTVVYAHALSEHTFTLHATLASALLNTTPLVDNGSGATLSVRPSGYSGQPIVPLREAITYKNRLVGLRGLADVAVSDPGDFLHFTPYSGALTLALGNGDSLQTLVPMGEDTLLFPSRTQVLGITGLSVNDPTVWQLRVITQEYGCVAPLSAVQVGRDVWMLSRQGVMSVRATDYGQNQGTAVPVSQPIQTKIDEIDWTHAEGACAAWFDNKYLLAVPLKGQDGTVTNNCVLVYNFLTQAWDHYWQGDGLKPKQFFRLTLAGAEYLCWLDADNSVKWFDPVGWEDITLSNTGGTWSYGSEPVDSYIVTRGYTAGNLRVKQWQETELVLAHCNPEFSITAITEGYNEQTTYRDGVTKDPSKWLTWNTADFNPATEPDRANLPYREDYSMFEGTGPNLCESLVWSGGYYVSFAVTAGATFDVVMNDAPYVSDDTSGGSPEFPDGNSITSDGPITSNTGYLYVWRPFNGPVTTIIREQSYGIALPDEGAPADAHQATHTRVVLRERCRMLQLKLANTQGSVRWRSVLVAGKQERGDY